MIPWSVSQELKYLASTYADQVRSSRHAAIITYKGNTISWGVNRYKTHPIMLQYQRNEQAIFLHAEMDAIVKGMRVAHVVEIVGIGWMIHIMLRTNQRFMTNPSLLSFLFAILWTLIQRV